MAIHASYLLGIESLQVVVAFFGAPLYPNEYMAAAGEVGACRPCYRLICSPPLRRTAPGAATQGWKKTPMLCWPAAVCRGLWSAPEGDVSCPTVLLPCWTPRQQNLLAEQCLASLLWKELQESVVRA